MSSDDSERHKEAMSSNSEPKTHSTCHRWAGIFSFGGMVANEKRCPRHPWYIQRHDSCPWFDFVSRLDHALRYKYVGALRSLRGHNQSNLVWIKNHATKPRTGVGSCAVVLDKRQSCVGVGHQISDRTTAGYFANGAIITSCIVAMRMQASKSGC